MYQLVKWMILVLPQSGTPSSKPTIDIRCDLKPVDDKYNPFLEPWHSNKLSKARFHPPKCPTGHIKLPWYFEYTNLTFKNKDFNNKNRRSMRQHQALTRSIVTIICLTIIMIAIGITVRLISNRQNKLENQSPC